MSSWNGLWMENICKAFNFIQVFYYYTIILILPSVTDMLLSWEAAARVCSVKYMACIWHMSLSTMSHFVSLIGCRSIQLCPEAFWSVPVKMTPFGNQKWTKSFQTDSHLDALDHFHSTPPQLLLISSFQQWRLLNLMLLFYNFQLSKIYHNW